jgi:hypothetical protein
VLTRAEILQRLLEARPMLDSFSVAQHDWQLGPDPVESHTLNVDFYEDE